MLTVLARYLYFGVCLSSRIHDNGVGNHFGTLEPVATLKGTSEADKCTLLSGYQDEWENSQFEFLQDVFAEGSFPEEGTLSVVEVLRCLAVRWKIDLAAIRSNDEWNDTLLFPAVNEHQVKAVQFLVASGVPVSSKNSLGYTVAQVAVQENCAECLSPLLVGGVNHSERFGENCSENHKKEDRCEDGWTFAHIAAKYNATDSLKILKQFGADLDAKDHMGLTPVSVAIRWNHLEFLEELGSLQSSFSISTMDGRTPAHFVCQWLGQRQASMKFMEIVHKFDGKLDATDDHGQTPAHFCASREMNKLGKENLQCLRFLHDNAIKSFDVHDSEGRTPEQVAESEHNEARVLFAKIEAEENLKQANKSKEMYKTEAHERKVLLDKAEKCKAYEKQVTILFDCGGNDIKVPEGVMLLKDTPGDDCGKSNCTAARCPNRAACPARDAQVDCKIGYDNTSPGCSRCTVNYGRLRQDPFQCGECGTIKWLSWLAYVGQPLGIYLVSLWTAQKKRDNLACLLKIWIAFGIVMGSISPSIKSSTTFQTVNLELARSVGATGEIAGASSNQMTGSSFDCLLQNKDASMAAWMGLSFAPPLVLWALTIIFLVGRFIKQHQSRAEVSKLIKDILKVSIVSTNCFLPAMVAALVRFLPCVHFTESGEKYMQFNVGERCDANIVGMRIAIAVAAALLGVMGPVYWVAVVMKSENWDDREEVLGFLMGGYRDTVYWWEATVLIRKCLLAVAVTLFSASYAPMLYLSSLLLIVGLSLAVHSYVKPYDDKFLNRVEFGSLMASFIAVFCTFLLKLESWAVDETVTVPASVLLLIMVTVPSLGLMALYCMEIRLDRFQPIVDGVKSAFVSNEEVS